MIKNKLNLETLCKMILIYNALLNGWMVKMVKYNKFEFIKSNKVIKKTKEKINISNFIKKNLILK